MYSAGIDIGSRTVKLVIFSDDKVIHSDIADNSYNTIEICKKMLDGRNYDRITATGYGRHLFAEHFESDVISEIKAVSIGVKHLHPNVRTILDIGGQDTKSISLDADGRIRKFEMNDKCAAGTGRFLEIMSMVLRYDLQEFSEAALSVAEQENVSSMCTVFAESEVVSMMGRGSDRAKIARGIHSTIINRSVSMLKRVGIEKDLVFVGGVAKCDSFRIMMESVLGFKVYIPKDPQVIASLGCALHNGKVN